MGGLHGTCPECPLLSNFAGRHLAPTASAKLNGSKPTAPIVEMDGREHICGLGFITGQCYE
jgi:hypothetical protein